MIEDQTSYAEALGLAFSLTPDLQLVGRAPDGIAGIELCEALHPDLVLTDYRLPGGDNGVVIASKLRESGFTGPISILTGFLVPQVLREAESIDLVNVLSKDTPITELVTTLRRVLAGETVETSIPPGEVRLSPGELQVLEMLNEGLSASEIAVDLHLSLHTIRARIKNCLRKLQVNSQLEATALATRLGLLVPPS